MRQTSRSAEPSAPRARRSRRPRRTAIAGALTAALTLGALAYAPAGQSSGGTAGSARPLAQQAAQQTGQQTGRPPAQRRAATGATTFEVATFNALGHSHTRPGGNRPNWEGSRKRMVIATQVIEAAGIDLIGFQEFEPQQYDEFVKQMSPRWSIAPGLDAPGTAQSKAIAWRSADWTLVSQTTFMSPYFSGNMQARPLVQLRHNRTGQLIWVLNTHNPANTRGNALKWRQKAERIQADLVNRLRRQQPDVPVILLGDMNDRERFYCSMTAMTDLQSASGGYRDVARNICEPYRPMKVDWVMGTSDIAWTGYTTLEQGAIKRASDHALVYATATVLPNAAAAAGVKRVVVIDVQGLRSPTINPRQAPRLARIRDRGASTLAARTTEERTTALPNTVSMVTGRPVRPALGGHGVGKVLRGKDATVHRAAGRYVASIFDVAHDVGLSTAFYSGDGRSALLARSWNRRHGAVDRIGKNNGRKKFNKLLVTDNDARVVRTARAQLRKAAPALTVIQLDEPARAAEKHGPRSKRYRSALALADRRVGAIMRTIGRTPRTAGSTLVVITASGLGPSPTAGHLVPLLVWGPGVARGNLYTLNPGYSATAPRRKRYTGVQPIRSAAVANLVTSSLRLPPVPGSTINSRQDLQVFAPSLTDPGTTVPRS